MHISAIAIISKNRGLGLENHLLFHIPGELPRLKAITMGHPIIMGRKTFESIGKPLPGRLNIVITRDAKYKVAGAIVVDSLDNAINIAKKEIQDSEFRIQEQLPATDENEIFVLGGGQIFTEALPKIDKLYLTIVDTDVPADVFFPEYENEFTKVIEKEEKTDWDYPYRFLTLER